MSLLNNDLIEEISEERVNRCLCCNVSGSCTSPNISQESVDQQLKKRVNIKKLNGPILPKKTSDEKEPQRKVFCSKSCEKTF